MSDKYSSAQIKANHKYNKKNYKRVSLYVKNEEMNIIENFCKNNNYSKNNLFIEGVKEKIEKDTGKSFDEFIKENQPEQEQHQEQDQKNADND